MTDLVIIKIFSELEDPRNTKTKNFFYPLDEILLVAFATLLSGGLTYADMRLFGRAKLDFFRTILPFKNGIPSQDTFEEVFSMLNPKKFEQCLAEWATYLKVNYDGEIIAIDGKALRRSGTRTVRPLHMVNAWAHKNRVVLCCKPVHEKSNEITAIPEVLRMLSLKGTIVTMDAMGCQTHIADQIVEQDGDYVIALKGNQGNLHDDVTVYFEHEKASRKKSKKIATHETLEKDHGRIEKRRYGFCTDISWLKSFYPEWHTINAIGYVESERTIDEKTSFETHYFIISKDIGVIKFAEAARVHWGVENSVHNFLDVSLSEDYSRVRNRNAAHNLAIARRMIVNRIEAAKGPGLSKRGMRLKAGWDNDYLKSLLLQ